MFRPIPESERLEGIDRVKRWLEERDRRNAEERARQALESTHEWKARRRQDELAELHGGA